MNIGERKLCEFKHGMSGSFYRSLFETIFLADNVNSYALQKGFKQEVDAVLKYRNETGYWDKLENEFKQEVKNGK